MSTFIEQCLSGDALLDEIYDFIDKWHDGEEGDGLELYEYLGMTENEYILWSSAPSILSKIIYARNNNEKIETIIYNEYQPKLAARSKKADQLLMIKAWLNKKGYRI